MIAGASSKKVCVSSLARFHTFDLARQLQRAGALQRLYTAYPRWKVDGLPHDLVSTFPWVATVALGAGRLGLHSFQRALDWPMVKTFDAWVAQRIEHCEVFHCLSNYGLASHRIAKSKCGALTICDRGSSHIQYQEELLREEYTRLGMPYRSIESWTIERELAEYEECDLIFVPSRFARRSFIERGITEKKLRVNPYGVDLHMFRPTQKQDKLFRIIYVGALSVRKGIQYLLAATSRFPPNEVEVWLIGSALPEAKLLLKAYEGRFRYFGMVPRTELYQYYGQGSVFVIASIEEGLALVQAQAMACGLPVISTINTGAEDLLTDGVEGFVVPIRDTDAIADRIARLLRQPDLRDAMAESALKRVSTLGGWDAYGRRAMSIYSEALAPRLSALH